MTVMPKGLEYQGQKLWKAIVSDYDLEEEPHKRRILFDACKVADLVDKLEKAMTGQPMTVKGSQLQPVIHPLISEVRYQRGLLAQLLARLNFAPAEED